MLKQQLKTNHTDLTTRQQVKQTRYDFMDGLSSWYIAKYLVWRHRVFVLASGYIIIPTLILVIHYR